jgi:hypothetical protein
MMKITIIPETPNKILKKMIYLKSEKKFPNNMEKFLQKKKMILP